MAEWNSLGRCAYNGIRFYSTKMIILDNTLLLLHWLLPFLLTTMFRAHKDLGGLLSTQSWFQIKWAAIFLVCRPLMKLQQVLYNWGAAFHGDQWLVVVGRGKLGSCVLPLDKLVLSFYSIALQVLFYLRTLLLFCHSLWNLARMAL